MGALLRDLRLAARSLRRSRGFSTSVVAILALGIGANTAIVSVVRGVLLRRLPYPAPERLVMVPAAHHPDDMGEEISPANFLDLRRETSSFEQLGAFGPMTVNLLSDGRPERLQAAQISPAALAAFGVRPLHGRLFLSDEERPESRVAVLSFGLWKSRFGGDRAVVGRTIRLSGVPYPVVGILPPEFRFPKRLGSDVQLFVPLRITAERAGDRQSRWLYAVGRLKPGVAPAAAARELDARTAALARAFPKENAGWGVRVVPMREYVVGRVRPALLILLATSLLALAAACANVGNLALARASTRRGEMAIRAAIGASAKDLLRPHLLESLLLALSGGAVGALLAFAGRPFLVAALPPEIPRLDEIRVDPAVLAATLAVSLLVGVSCGLLPALLARRTSPADGLRTEGRSGSGSGSARARRLVTVAEVATALVLLVGAGLLLSSLARLLAVAPGFDARDVLTMEVVLPPARYPGDAAKAAFYRALTARAAALPGVESTGGISHLPLSGSNSTDSYLVEGFAPADPNEIPEAAVRTVTPGYFRTFSIPLLTGRDFLPSDRAGSAPVLIVNRGFANRYWGIGQAIGKRIFFAGSQGKRAPFEVVGVVGDVHHTGLDIPPVPEMYVAYEQQPWDAMVLLVRSRAVSRLAPALRDAVASLDPELPVFNVRMMDSVLAGSTSEPRFYAELISAFAALALLLAAAGIYSVLAYSAALRRREMAIRLALGAPRAHVAGLLFREAISLAGAGIAAGLVAAIVASRAIASLLFGLRPFDLPVYIATAGLLAAVAVVASLVPAARCARVRPVSALRST
jgi:putative ABC transport system permease protein